MDAALKPSTLPRDLPDSGVPALHPLPRTRPQRRPRTGALPEHRHLHPRRIQIRFRAKRGAFARLLLRNLGLMITTLGLYWFWARTQVRRHVFGHLMIDGNRLCHTGRGLDVLTGFLSLAAATLAILAGADMVLAGLAPGDGAVPLAVIALMAGLVILPLKSIFRTRRYVLNRTTWRGMQCRLEGNSWHFLSRMVLPLLATIVTLGAAYPWLSVHIQRYLIGNMALGATRFTYRGRARDLMRTWLLCWVLAVPTLGLSLVWWRGFLLRYNLNATRLGNLRLFSRLDTWRTFRDRLLGSLAGLILVHLTLALVFWGTSSLGNLAEMPGLDMVFDPASTAPDSALFLGMVLRTVMPAVAMALVGAPLAYTVFLYFVDHRVLVSSLSSLRISGYMDLSAIGTTPEAPAAA